MNTEIAVQKREVAVSNFRGLVDLKKNILSSEVVRKGLGEIDLMIAEAGIMNPVILMDDAEFVKIVVKVIQNIAVDVGVRDFTKESNPYEYKRLLGVIRTHYKDLTLSEIKKAFELSLLGELDTFFQKDKNGFPDKNHYQSFNLDYFMKIMGAYKKRKRETWSKAHKLLPDLQTVVTDEEKNQFRESFINDIIRKFNRYRDEGVPPMFLAKGLVIKYLVSSGILEVEPEIEDEDIQAAFVQVCDSTVNSFKKKFIKDKFNVGVYTEEVSARAAGNSNQRNIIECFDAMIENKISIEEMIKI